MIPYLAPEAHIPITSWAPRFAAMNARLVIQTGTDRPDVRKSSLVSTRFFTTQPIPKHEGKVQRQNRVVDESKGHGMFAISVYHWQFG